MATVIPQKLAEFRAHRPNPEKAKQLSDAERVATSDNGVAKIRYFEADGRGRVRPFLKVEPSPTEDPAPLAILLDAKPETLEALKQDPAKFDTFLREVMEARRDYLRPTKESLGVNTEFKLNHIVGLRVSQFKREARALAAKLYPAGELQDKALRAANIAGRELIFGRLVSFDPFEMEGYGSFGHDAAFTHVYEKQLKALEAVDVAFLTPDQKARLDRQKKQLQSEIDAIFRSKYVFHSNDMREGDAENALGLVAIDARSRRRISEKPSTAGTLVPEFETLTVDVGGETKPIYWDAEKKKHFFEDSGAEVTAEHGPIRREDVLSKDVTFRRAKDGEALRNGFRFDWSSDGYVQRDVIDWVSWAGHCNDKAALEAAGLIFGEEHPGVTVYDSASGKRVHFDRNLLNEALLSFSELGAEMSDLQGRRAGSLGGTVFAGARDDDRPDRIVLDNGRRIPMNDRTKLVIERVTVGGEEIPADKAFAKYKVAEDEMSAEPNPLFRSIVEGDVVELALGAAKIKASLTLQVYDENGEVTTEDRELELDFANPPAEPILVDTTLGEPRRREIYEMTLAAKDGQWTWNYQKFQMVKPEGKDKFEKVKVEGESSSEPFDPAKVAGRHESSLDLPEGWLPFMDEALATGLNATAETADGAGVWNGRMLSLEKGLVERRGDWERVTAKVAARYGENTGRYLTKLDARGEPEFHVPLELAADFFWRQQIAFAPERDGRVNAKALQRGLIGVEGGVVHAEALADLMEILHLAGAGKAYSVLHNGERFVFETKEDFEAEVARLAELRSAAIEGGDANQVVRVERSGEVRGPMTLEPIEIPADAMVTVQLDEGAVSLSATVTKPGRTEGRTHALWPWNDERSVTFAAEKGDRVTVSLEPDSEAPTPYKVTVISDPTVIPDVRAPE